MCSRTINLITLITILLSLLSCSRNAIANKTLNNQRVPASKINRASCNLLLSRIFGEKKPAFLQNTDDFLENVGANLKVLTGNSGEKRTIFLDANADTDHIKKIMKRGFHYDISFRVGHILNGLDEKRWVVESLDDYGHAILSNNENKFSWNSGIYSSHIYIFKIQSIGHSITVTIPPLKDGSNDKKTLKRIAKVVRELPLQSIRELDKINVHTKASKWDEYWSRRYGYKWLPAVIDKLAFPSSAAGGGKLIYLFPAGNDSFGLLNLFRHELGHVLASSIYGKTMPDDTWRIAMEADGRSVSSYAKSSMAEDFAETIMDYFKVKGGLKDSWLFKPSYQKYEARFSILDKYFELNLEEHRKALDTLISVRRIKLATGATAVTFISSSSYYIFFYDRDAAIPDVFF